MCFKRKTTAAITNKQGMTLIEIMMAVAIIGLVVVPLVRTLFNGMKGITSYGNAAKATQLAQELMEEIKAKKWDEKSPNNGDKATGPYSAIGTDTLTMGLDGAHAENKVMPPVASWDGKVNWDDIDDYNGLTEFPPRDTNNALIAHTEKYTRVVQIRYVLVPNTTAPPGTNPITPAGVGVMTEYKEVIITVTWEGMSSATGVTISTVRANIKRY